MNAFQKGQFSIQFKFCCKQTIGNQATCCALLAKTENLEATVAVCFPGTHGHHLMLNLAHIKRSVKTLERIYLQMWESSKWVWKVKMKGDREDCTLRNRSSGEALVPTVDTHSKDSGAPQHTGICWHGCQDARTIFKGQWKNAEMLFLTLLCRKMTTLIFTRGTNYSRLLSACLTVSSYDPSSQENGTWQGHGSSELRSW